MSLATIFSDIIQSRQLKLSKTESKIMETLIALKRGNAYNVWKESKLKYYPTVLRTLRRLDGRNFVEILSQDGLRGETIYAPTLEGLFVFYILKNEERKILDFLSSNSRLFQELYDMKKDKTWMYAIIREFFWSKNRKKLTLDETVKNLMEMSLGDGILNVRYDPEAHKKLMELSRLSWVRPLIIKLIESEIDRTTRDLKALSELRDEFVT